MNYRDTPPEIYRIVTLFQQNNLAYNLFKCEHIFTGLNKNLDILFENNDDYRNASQLLEKEGFRLFLPEKVEKFKKMYVRFVDGKLIAIHLHREVAWHGIKVLDKKEIFSNAKEIFSGIFVPSKEDALLIHSAHTLFENFKIRERELQVLPNYVQDDLNWDYVGKQIKKNNWQQGFDHFLYSYKKGKNVEKKEIVKNYLGRLVRRPKDLFYLSEKVVKSVVRKISLKRKGTLIALIGVNGTGKTTLSNEIMEKYQPLTKFLGMKQKSYYFGWQPFSPLAKLGGKLFRRKEVFKGVTGKNDKEISLFQEALFVYNYLDYSLRYLFHLYPQLRKRNFVVTDRYFYDIYGQYPYAKKSKVVKMLIKLFPKPDYTFVLDASTESIMNRSKSGEERKVKSREYLEGQRERYLELDELIKVSTINTEKDIQDNVSFIIDKSWGGIVGRIR